MAKMIAMAVPHAGAKLQQVERDIPQPRPRELLIRVHACGVCHSDVVTVEGGVPGIVSPSIIQLALDRLAQSGLEANNYSVKLGRTQEPAAKFRT